MHSQNAIRRLPVFVISTTSHDVDHQLRSATIACRQAGRGAIAFSSHWGAPEILIGTAATASLELAARATQLLRTAGLIDCFRQAIPPQRPDIAAAKALIRVSIPAHFGVELMLLAGAVLRPLHDRQVPFVALCGTIDAALRDRFDSSSLEELKRYANQLPKQRVNDLYPLFCLIGAWSGIARGVLDHVLTEKTTVIRRMPAIRPSGGRVSYRAEKERTAGLPATP
jgi:hypothetical protein